MRLTLRNLDVGLLLLSKAKKFCEADIRKEIDMFDDWMTNEDMVRALRDKGFTVSTQDRRNNANEHEVLFTVMHHGRILRRILNEYNIGSIMAIQKNRQRFIQEIINEFEKEEKENAMNNNNIKWRVCDVKIDSSMYNGTEISCKLEGKPDPIGRVNPMTLQEDLEKKLNAPERKDGLDALADIHRMYIAGGRQNGKTFTQFAMYAKMLGLEPSTKLPEIKKVIFNDPATIVIWTDETKTVVKAENEAYDPEKGLAMAITKKALGNEGRYYDTIKKWLEKYEVPVSVETSFAEAIANANKSIKKLAKALNNKKEEGELVRNQIAIKRLRAALDDKNVTKAGLKVTMENVISYLELREEASNGNQS